MSEEEKSKPTVCENFEPQAWRKTICKNCFQSPEKHVAGGGAAGHGHGGKENKPPPVPEKPKPPKPLAKQPIENKGVMQKAEKDKPGTSLANSIKSKYEKLESDKHSAKEPPNVAPKAKSGLSSITDKYEKLKGDKKSNESIPPASQAKKDSVTALGPKALSIKDEHPKDQLKSVNRFKSGSVENLSKVDEKMKIDVKLGSKSKFGSTENVASVGKSKDPIEIPIQRSKFGGSVDSLSSDKGKQSHSGSDLAKRTLLNKLDDFTSELKAGATSKVGSTVIHKQTDGNVDIITIPKKTSISKPLDNESLQNEMNELKMSRIGDKSGQIKPQNVNQSDSKLASSKVIDKKDLSPVKVTHITSDLKSNVNQSESNKTVHAVTQEKKDVSPAKSVSPERKPGFKLDMGKSEEAVDAKKLVRRNSGFKLDISRSSESPEIKPGFKIEFNKSESPTKDPKRRNSGFKLEFDKSESPTKEPLRSSASPEKKSGFKLNFNKSESPTKEPHGEKRSGFKLSIGSSPSPTKDIHPPEDKSKIDLRAGLKKTEVKQNETSKLTPTKSDGKQKFEFPHLKSPKDKSEPFKEQEKESIDTKTETNKLKHETKEKDSSKTESSKGDVKQKFDLPPLKSSKEKIENNSFVQKDSGKEIIEKDKTEKIDEREKKESIHSSVTLDKIRSQVDDSETRVKDSSNAFGKEKSNEKNNATEQIISHRKDSDIINKDDKRKDESNVSEEPSKPKIVEDIAEMKEVVEGPTLSTEQKDKVDKINKNVEKKEIEQDKISHKELYRKDLNEKSEKKETESKDKTEAKVLDLKKDKINKTSEPETTDLKQIKNDTKLKPDITDTKTKTPDEAEKKTLVNDVSKKDDDKRKVESPFLKTNKSESDEKKNSQVSDDVKDLDVKKHKIDKTFKPDTTDIKQVKSDTKLKVDNRDTKTKISDDLQKKTLVNDVSKKDDGKRKVESPFLKTNKSESDEKKNSQDSKQKKTFEVPKLKSTKGTDEKQDKTAKPDSKLSKAEEAKEPKRKFEVPSLKSGKEEKDRVGEKKFDLKAGDTKKKFELPTLKSSKEDDKEKLTDKKPLVKDEKGKLFGKTDTRSDDKKKFEVPKLKSAKPEEPDKKSEPPSWKKNDQKDNIKKDEPKKKFELPNLKSTKGDDKFKTTDKLKVEESKDKLNKPNFLKSTKDEKKQDNTKMDQTKKKPLFEDEKPGTKTFERPQLKSTKDKSSKDTKPPEDAVGKLKSLTDKKDSTAIEKAKSPENTFHIQHKGANEREKPGSIPVQTPKSNDSPSTSAIGTEHFETVSTDNEAKLTDNDYVCANNSAIDSDYLHVDTQVFTSSRNKSAGVIEGLDKGNLAAVGVSDLLITKRDTDDSVKIPVDQSSTLQNGPVSPLSPSLLKSNELDEDKSIKSEIPEESSITSIDSDEISRLKKELLLMTERCSSLKKENLSLLDGLTQKDKEQTELKRQKDDADVEVKGLKRQLQSVEQTCEQLESDNKNLKNTLKDQGEQNKVNEEIIRKQKEDSEIKSGKENKDEIIEGILEENEELKREIAELKLEMDEMYDSFRDQEAEEFRELQKELEITAKNCRILQFKLRKLERHNDQVEHDRNQFEDRLRRLQDQFQDRDAVSHIHSLEDELRMAKDVSVRLHDELDLLEEKRGKMEEENRHLTELLEQADRKQFRLELEVDKLRDKVLQLRTELNAAKDPNSSEPRKLNCAEFLAIHREVI